MSVGPVHKDNHEKDRLVAAWRHKEWLLCPVFALSRLLFHRINVLGNSIDFMWRTNRHKELPKWQHRKLLQYKNYDQLVRPLKKALTVLQH